MISVTQWNEAGKILPEPDVHVLTNRGLYIWTGEYWRRSNISAGGGIITHWAEIPEILPVSTECSQCEALRYELDQAHEQLSYRQFEFGGQTT